MNTLAHTLAIDIGGTGLKASVLDPKGKMLTERARVETPHPLDPAILIDTLARLVTPLPAFDRISVGFPGVVRHGKVVTAPNLGTKAFAGFDLAGALGKRLGGKPVRVLNDADMQGFGVIRGKGLEMVITLGTGFGTALFYDGRLAPHLEISQLKFRKGETYDRQLGQAARKEVGNIEWNRRVRKAIANLRVLTNFDRLHVGGGNAKKLEGDLGEDVEIADNAAGILGGIKLWDERD